MAAGRSEPGVGALSHVLVADWVHVERHAAFRPIQRGAIDRRPADDCLQRPRRRRPHRRQRSRLFPYPSPRSPTSPLPARSPSSARPATRTPRRRNAPTRARSAGIPAPGGARDATAANRCSGNAAGCASRAHVRASRADARPPMPTLAPAAPTLPATPTFELPAMPFAPLLPKGLLTPSSDEHAATGCASTTQTATYSAFACQDLDSERAARQPC